MPVLLESVDPRGVATLRLNRPEKRNAFDGELVGALHEALQRLGERSDVRLVTLEGVGENFCAGADIDWMARGAQKTLYENEEDAFALAAMLLHLDRLSKPTLAVAHGGVFGAGVGLIACCDIVVAADDAYFSLSEVRLGITPAMIAPFLIRAIGMRQTRRLTLSGESIFAEAALGIGLVHQVTPKGQLNAARALIVEGLLDGAPGAQADAKDFLERCQGRPVDDELLREAAHSLALRRSTDEAGERLRAFLDKSHGARDAVEPDGSSALSDRTKSSDR